MPIYSQSTFNVTSPHDYLQASREQIMLHPPPLANSREISSLPCNITSPDRITDNVHDVASSLRRAPLLGCPSNQTPVNIYVG